MRRCVTGSGTRRSVEGCSRTARAGSGARDVGPSPCTFGNEARRVRLDRAGVGRSAAGHGGGCWAGECLGSAHGGQYQIAGRAGCARGIPAALTIGRLTRRSSKEPGGGAWPGTSRDVQRLRGPGSPRPALLSRGRRRAPVPPVAEAPPARFLAAGRLVHCLRHSPWIVERRAPRTLIATLKVGWVRLELRREPGTTEQI